MSWSVYAVAADAELETGRLDAAERAVTRLLELRPGVASFTRAARLLELRGQPERADEALRRGAGIAAAPQDEAFCHFRRGDLAAKRGRPNEALGEYERALAAVPGYVHALAGRAKVKAALGRPDEAIADYVAATSRVPTPRVVLELADLFLAQGRAADAKEQFALLKAQRRLLREAGASDDLTFGRYETEHGDPAKAVRLLTSLQRRQPTAEVAEALERARRRAGRQR